MTTQDFQIELLTQKLAFAQQQIQDRDNELQQYKALVSTLEVLIGQQQAAQALNKQQQQQPQQQQLQQQQQQQPQRAEEEEKRKSDSISKYLAEFCGDNFDEPTRTRSLVKSRSSGTANGRYMVPIRKTVSFHDSVQVHYFGVPFEDDFLHHSH